MFLSTLYSDPFAFILMVIAILVALTVHEFSHALAATLLGDQTAKRMGRLTLNPFAHIDIFGFLALVFVGFGWGKPVPYNPYNLKNRRWGSIIVGIAGPISNFIFLALSALLLHLTAPIFGGKYLIVFLAYLFQFNVILMLFNLIPIPPLDGSKVVIALLDQPKYLSVRNQYETYGPWALMILILAEALLGLNIFGYILNTPYSWIIDLFRMN